MSEPADDPLPAVGGAADDAPADPAAHHRRRVRASARLLLGGLLLGVVLAALLGSQASGAAGLAFLLLGTTLGSALAGLHHGVLLVADEVRGRPTSPRRGAWLLLYLALTAALMAAVVGIGT